MMKNKFITCALPYSNGQPHIGHAFEFIIGDALSRYFRQSGCDVFFNIGLDEHGLKIQQTAEKNGLSPQEYVDSLVGDWKIFIEKLGVSSWDNFYRTSDEDHKFKVQKFWEDALNRGDIYKKEYSGTYCVGCESFKSDRELIDGKCPDHPTTELNEVEEENYFFRLSKYKNALSTWAYKATEFIEPISKRAEFLNIIDNIQDISVSRLKKDVYWATDVPGDEEHTVYVWCCALLNYIFAAGHSSGFPVVFESLWNGSEVIQICGPDNLKFQSVIFQGILASAGIKKSDKLLVHGTILDSKGKKMSKSEGNVVDPIEQVEKYGVSAVRYYALAGLSTYGNSSWDENQLVELYNSHLADDFGNLVSRVTHLADKILGERTGAAIIDYNYIGNIQYCKNFDKSIIKVKESWDNYKISEALSELNRLVKELNRYITFEKPWEDLGGKSEVVFQILYCLREINKLYYPVIPGKSEEVTKALVECRKAIVFPKLETKKEKV